MDVFKARSEKINILLSKNRRKNKFVKSKATKIKSESLASELCVFEGTISYLKSNIKVENNMLE